MSGRLLTCLCWCLLLFLPARVLQAQTHTFLSNDHWTRAALHRLAVNGQVDAAAASVSWPASRAELAEWLLQANAAAGDQASAARVPSAARVQFMRDVYAREQRAGRRVQAGFALGASTSDGAVRAGTMQSRDSGFYYSGPVQLPGSQHALIRADLQAQLTGAVSAGATGRWDSGRAELEGAVLALRLSGWHAWAGRRPLTLGSGPGAGLVLNGATVDGGGIAVRNGLRLPLLGQVVPELTVARMSRSGSVQHPWFHAARLTIAPTSSLAIGLNRAAIFGGENNISVTPWRLLLMLMGRPDYPGKDSDFENQVAAVDVFWRTRLSGVPIALHGEAGADDAGYFFLRVPGLIGGVEVGEVPGLPELALGLEAVHIAERCCSYPPWYQHAALADGWTDRGKLLGHPLGGAGDELALHWRVDAPGALLAAGRLYRRQRAAENLLAPLRQGSSTGGRAELLVPWRRAQLQVRAEAEFGLGWQTSTLSVLGQVFFD